MDLGASRAAREFTNELGRQALLRRRRTGAMDQQLPAVDGDLGPRASIAVHIRRLLVRSTGRDLGIQCRPATWPSAGIYRARYRARHGVLAVGRRCAMRVSVRRHGLYPWVGLPIRTWRYLYRRQVDHALQNLADHREVIAAAGI